MADNSKIEWTDASWNPIRARNRQTGKVGWHCETVSEGCRNCYAAALNENRFGTALPYKPGHRADIELFLDEKMLMQPLKWRRGRKIFVCSMTDIFADFVPDAWIDRIFAVMALCPQHTFQVLTKRSARMREYMTAPGIRDRIEDTAYETEAKYYPIPIVSPLPNVWLGVSVEDQRTADERIPILLSTPAAVRWISAEPLLGPVDFTRVGTLHSIRAAMPDVVEREARGRPLSGDGSISGAQIDAVGSPRSSITFFQTPDHMGGFSARSPRAFPRLNWVVVGGESGKGARVWPGFEDEARAIHYQCDAAGVAFFMKQMQGATKRAMPPIPDDLMIRQFPRIEHNAMPQTEGGR